MQKVIAWISTWIRPDRRSLSELADFLGRRKKAASRWDHSHLTRRLATRNDANEYQALPPEKRFVLLQAARFCTSYYAAATLPALALGIALVVPMMLKQADAIGIPIDYQVTLVYGIAGILIFFGIVDIFNASKSAAHAKTWVAAFDDVETKLAAAPRLSQPCRQKLQNMRTTR